MAEDEGWTLTLCCWRKEPWACSLVLMTSKGHVTMPEARPASEPHKGLTRPGGILATAFARAGAFAYACARVVEDGVEVGVAVAVAAAEGALSPEAIL